jgi:hypothetical protein
LLRLDVDGLEAGEAYFVEAEEVDSYFSISVGVAAVDGEVILVLAVEEVGQPGIWRPSAAWRRRLARSTSCAAAVSAVNRGASSAASIMMNILVHDPIYASPLSWGAPTLGLSAIFAESLATVHAARYDGVDV